MLRQVVCVDRVKMDLQRPKAKPVADAICAAVAMAVGPEETLVSGYCCTNKPLDENAPKKKR